MSMRKSHGEAVINVTASVQEAEQFRYRGEVALALAAVFKAENVSLDSWNSYGGKKKRERKKEMLQLKWKSDVVRGLIHQDRH